MMTFPSDERPEKSSLINYERTWRTVRCMNPEHEGSLQYETNEVGDITCPMCNSPMVTLVKPIVKTHELD